MRIDIPRRILAAVAGALLVPAALLAAVEGKVLSEDGAPVEHARVEAAGSDAMVFTNDRGHFRLETVEPPADIFVSHPRFVTGRAQLPKGASGPLEFRLVPKQEVYEEIAVTATRGADNFAPVSVATSIVKPEAAVAPPATLTELVASVPGVAENGQGGIFQTYSIRGVSRLRVLTLLAGMRIVGERRAGVSASFVDPLLMRSVDVIRGPSSTFYGSGALGGVVQLFPATHDGASVRAGYGTQGDENYQVVGWGDEQWDLGLARRQAGDAETPVGERLNSAFTQTSATVRRSWSGERLEYELLGIGSAGRDIGKSNTQFPERNTTYPDENHLLMRFSVRARDEWSFEAWAHPNDLETLVVDDSGRSLVDNDAVDLGFNFQKRLSLGWADKARVGIDYFGRRSVDALEENDLAAGLAVFRTLDGGEEDEAGLYGAMEWDLGSAVVLAGGRFAWQQQENAGVSGPSDSAWTGFAGLVAPLGKGFEVVANVGTGLRFPSLGERFFSGTTGRGRVEGNVALDPERSLNLDAGLRWYGNRLFLSTYLFRNEIDDYIERVEIEPDVLAFVNLTSGKIEGLELEGFVQLSGPWSLSFGGHAIEGRADSGEPLADIPADRLFLAGRWSSGKWSWSGRWESRAQKSDPGSGEKPIPSAQLLSSSVGLKLSERLELSLSGRNLLDEEYFNAPDRRVPLSPGRSLALGISWSD